MSEIVDTTCGCDPENLAKLMEPSTKVIQKIITSPGYYTEGRVYEPRKVIYDWGLNFNLGNVVKYVSRAGRKEGQDALIDLHKARQYLEFEIEEIENARNS